MFSFVRDVGTNEVIFKFGDFTRNIQNTVLNDVKITLEEEKEAGDELIKQYKDKYTFKNDGVEYFKLNTIMKDLVKRLANQEG